MTLHAGLPVKPLCLISIVDDEGNEKFVEGSRGPLTFVSSRVASYFLKSLDPYPGILPSRRFRILSADTFRVLLDQDRNTWKVYAWPRSEAEFRCSLAEYELRLKSAEEELDLTVRAKEMYKSFYEREVERLRSRINELEKELKPEGENT